MAHLTYFDTVAEYNEYINSEDYASPNISYCADADAVFMKENFIPSMSAVFNIPYDNYNQKIAYSTNGIKAIRVDGQLIGELSTNYTFKTAGNHTVEYQFKKQNTIPNKIFYDFTAVTSVDLSGIVNIGDDNFYNYKNTQFGAVTINGNIGNNCFYYAYGLTSIVVNGNIGDSNFSSASGLTAVTINGNIGQNNFGSCDNIETLIIGGNITGYGNFSYSGSKYNTIEIGGNVEQSSNFYCNNNLTTDITIGGNVNNGYFYSGDTLTISGNCGGNPTINYWKDVVIGGSVASNGMNFMGVENVTINGDISGQGTSWAQNPIKPGQTFTIKGSITNTYNFTAGTMPMVDVGGSISDTCFNNINITDTTAYTVHGNVGNGSFNAISGLTDVTVDGNVGVNSFGCNASNPSSITALTLTNKCTSYSGYTGDIICPLTSLTIQATTPPAFSNTLPTTNFQIFVPASAVDTYKAASGWSTYASQIQAIPNE